MNTQLKVENKDRRRKKLEEGETREKRRGFLSGFLARKQNKTETTEAKWGL